MCPLCGSEVLMLLGQLGRLLWLRCRDCGINVSQPAEAS